jgi:hypothetical protein
MFAMRWSGCRIKELNARFPQDADIQLYWLPMLRAQLALNDNRCNNSLRDLANSLLNLEIQSIQPVLALFREDPGRILSETDASGDGKSTVPYVFFSGSNGFDYVFDNERVSP